MPQYKCLNFKLEELVPRELFAKYGTACWELFDSNALRTIDELREYFGVSVTINNWVWGGKLENCGFRTPDYYKEFSRSQHLYGRAFDLHFAGMSAEDVRQEIVYRRKFANKFIHIGGMELDVDWVHIDTRNTDKGRPESGGIFLFKP